MPTSLTPPPADDEIECANCGAYVYIELTRCPNCGVNLYEPEDNAAERPRVRPKSKFSLAMESFLRKLRGKAHPAEELFNNALREATLFNDLLQKVGGDRSVVERLIAYEHQERPNATRLSCLQRAIRRWERENH
jgi:hypothetical protein